MIGKFGQLTPPLYILFAGTMITRLGAFVFPYLTIYLSGERGYGFEVVGVILSVGSLGLLAGNFFGGMLADKWSRKRTMIGALLLNAGGFAGLAFQYEWPWVYALFLFVGYLGSGMYTPAANTVIADLTDAELRPFAYTLNYVCINLGMGLGPLMGGILAEISYFWIFVGDVATSMTCAILILLGIGETRGLRTNARNTVLKMGDSPKTARSESSMSVWWSHRTVLAFCLVYFFMIGPLMGMEYTVPLLVKLEFKADLFVVGVVYSINAAFILSFSFLIEKLIRGRNEYLMMIASGVIWTSGMSVLLIGMNVSALLICIGTWTLGEIIASILVPTFVSKRVPEAYKGRFMAINDIVRSFAGVVCPIGLGMIWSLSSAWHVVLAITLMPMIGTILYAMLFGLAILNQGRVNPQTAILETRA